MTPIEAPWGLLAVLAFACVAALGLWARRHVREDPDPVRRGILLTLLLAPFLIGAGTRPGATKRITTLTLRNRSRTIAQPAYAVSRMFGQGFLRGDMPTGKHPRFVLSDGTECPATLWGVTSWPDGSMKFCGAMVRVPAEIPAGRSVTIDVTVGDPSDTRARRLDELVDADIRIELTGVAGLDGVWTASLPDAIERADDVVEIGSGSAGTIWRIGGEFRNAAKKAHGQLYCWHYVAALTGDGDRMAGIRYLGRVAQPWADVTRPAARRRDFNARLMSGDTVIRQLQGHTDSEEAGHVIGLPHYASFFTAGSDARWDEIGGETVAPSTHLSFDSEYLQRSRLVPPFDLTTPVDPRPTVGYRAMGAGSMVRYMGTTGEREDIGVFPEWNVQHLITQGADHEHTARVNGLASGGWALGFRKRGTRLPVPGVDLKPTYTGLGKPETKWRGRMQMGGMVIPEPSDQLWYEDVAHRPGAVYWPYLFTGEPQYLDLLIEQAFEHVLALAPSNETVIGTDFPRATVLEGPWSGERGYRIGAGGRVHKGSGILLNDSGGLRSAAWRTRDIAQAAALAPDVAPDGAAVREYLRDVMASSHAAFADFTSQVPTSYSDAGLFVMSDGDGSPWMLGYLSWSVCHQADILDSPEAASVRRYLSRFWETVATSSYIGCLVAYRCRLQDDRGGVISRADDLLGHLEVALTASAATSRLAIDPSSPGPNRAWAAHDGDVFAFEVDHNPAPDAAPMTKLYAVGCDGESFQLAATPGGAPLELRDSSIPRFYARFANFSPDITFSASNGASAYAANIRGAVTYHHARGDSVSVAKLELDRIAARLKIDYRGRPKYSARSDWPPRVPIGRSD